MPEVYWTSTREQMGYSDCPVSFMYCPWPLYAYCTLGPSHQTSTSFDLELQGSMGIPLGNGGALHVGMY